MNPGERLSADVHAGATPRGTIRSQASLSVPRPGRGKLHPSGIHQINPAWGVILLPLVYARDDPVPSSRMGCKCLKIFMLFSQPLL